MHAGTDAAAGLYELPCHFIAPLLPQALCGSSIAGCAGLTVFAIGPSTLAQGQTLVRQAGGNTTLALMLLVMTNTLAVFIAPFLIKAMLASQANGVKLDSAHLLINLVITVLAPSIVGKVQRPPKVGRPPHDCLRCIADCAHGAMR